MTTQTTVAALPACDVCKALGYDEPKEASYDARTRTGQWAYLCDDHFELHGLGKLGTGFGQRLVLKGADK